MDAPSDGPKAIVQVHAHRHTHDAVEYLRSHDSVHLGDVVKHNHAHVGADPNGELQEINLAELTPTQLRQVAKTAAPDMAKALTDAARDSDPLGDPVLLSHPASYYKSLAARASDPELARGYREMARERERAAPQPRQAFRPPSFIGKSSQRRR
jgi:hypothetical protein